jgi:hypothetical protein
MGIFMLAWAIPFALYVEPSGRMLPRRCSLTHSDDEVSDTACGRQSTAPAVDGAPGRDKATAMLRSGAFALREASRSITEPYALTKGAPV